MHKYSTQLISICKNNGNIKISKNKLFKELLILETSFLDINSSISVRSWYVNSNTLSQLKCKICKIKNVKPNLRKDNTILSCSKKCAYSVIDPLYKKSIGTLKSEKQSKTLRQIDNKSGLTFAKLRADRGAITIKTKVNIETGLTIAEEIGLKTKKRVRSKHFNNLVKNTNVEILTTKNNYINSSGTSIKYKCIKCNYVRESSYNYIRCTKCHPYNKSMAENEVLEYCQSLTPNVISNTRLIIKPLELDIHIPDHKLAIEYNGLYWHSSDSLDSENKNYHLYKTQECEKQGIHLFHIFENEWLNPQKQVIWKSIIRNKLGSSDRIYARKTEIKSVSSKDKIKFLNGNHLQGNVGSSVNLGLYLGDELVSLMTFGRSRYDKKVDWELIRFCNRLGTSVVGAASRLLNAFRRENDGSIISYADKRHSNGNLYKQLGFEFSHESGPNYWYWKDSMNLESRLKYQKHKLKDQLDVFDVELTESENMIVNGYHKIYDCGNQVWLLN